SARCRLFAISTIRSVIERVFPEPAEAITEKLRSNSCANRFRAISSAMDVTSLPPHLQLKKRDVSAPTSRRVNRRQLAASRADISARIQNRRGLGQAYRKCRSPASGVAPSKNPFGRAHQPNETAVRTLQPGKAMLIARPRRPRREPQEHRVPAERRDLQ